MSSRPSGPAPSEPDDVPQHEPPASSAALFVPSVVESTLDLAVQDQFGHWCDCNGSLAYYDTPPDGGSSGFPAEATTWHFGGFALMTARTPASHFRRLPEHVRRDGIDHWAVTLAVEGERAIRVDDAVGVVRPGRLFINSLDQPSDSHRTRSRWITLFMPRDAFPAIGGKIDALRMKPVVTPMGMVLHDFLQSLAARLPQVRLEEAAQLAAATTAMVAAVAAPSADRQAEAAVPVQAVLGTRIRRLIRENAHLATLGPERLCRMLGMSRASLYRACEPFGGVASLIQTERLRAAQRALCDPADVRGIAAIAADVGFFNASTFNRLMRRQFGCTPGDIRRAALSGRSLPSLLSPAQTTQSSNLRSLLAGLQG
ncbi:helix-turn-helix domain-containing protein [Roseomonas sp. CCTCC AB2023176]|uniref:helix-turn-helix domain-containing protein n=1 Tax=Roseomonas sp. CCTCC AB2023176 TaxID=3342640 RepID=UPI0035D7137F